MSIARATFPFCIALLTVGAAAAATPATEEIRDATVAMGFDTKTRCPDLMQADAQENAGALVLFVVGPTGVPSRASVKSSSGSPDLDAAAVTCVMHLRFLPMVHAGDGNPISSWQEIAWKWGRFHFVTAGAVAPATSTAPAPSLAPAVSPPTAASSRATATEVRVCVDAAGRLAQDPAITRSSGDSALDAATLRIARSAAGSYPAPGCVRLTLTAGDSANETR